MTVAGSASSAIHARARSGIPRERIAHALEVGAVVITAALVVGAPGVAGPLFLPAMTVLAVLLYALSFRRYAEFAVWLWLLTPLARRLVELQTVWNPISPMLGAPFAASAVAGLSVLRFAPMFGRRRFMPLLPMAVAVVYGAVVGTVVWGGPAAIYGAATWLVPLVFGFALAVAARQDATLTARLTRHLAWATFLLGAYGIVQFVAPPSWDRFWMVNSLLIGVVGEPRPLEVRVFSTLHSPAPFAVFLVVGLLLVLARRDTLRWFAAGAGIIAFLLTLVRSAWGAWVLGAAIFATRVRTRTRLRAVGALILVAIALAPVMVFSPLGQRIGSRFDTFSQLDEDISLQARIWLYRVVVKEILQHPLGVGLGGTGGANLLAQGAGHRHFDSGVLDVFFSLGLPGGLLFSFGCAWLLYDWARALRRDRDPTRIALGAAGFAVVSLMLYFNSLVHFFGFLFWICYGLGFGAVRPAGTRA